MRDVRGRARALALPSGLRGTWGPLEVALEEEILAAAKTRLSQIRDGIIPREAAQDIDSAVEQFRKTHRQEFKCGVLLTRCRLRRETKSMGGVRQDLDEAWEIAERGSMKLYMADVHLHRARLFHGVRPYSWDQDEDGRPRGPKDDLAAARKLIESCGYWRRKGELEDAESAAASW